MTSQSFNICKILNRAEMLFKSHQNSGEEVSERCTTPDTSIQTTKFHTHDQTSFLEIKTPTASNMACSMLSAYSLTGRPAVGRVTLHLVIRGIL